MYKIYKGVQKPVMFKGMKGKYIYIAGGVIGGGLLFIIIFSSILGFLISIGIGIGIVVGGMTYVLGKQSQGLYSKNKEQGKFIVRNRLTKF